MTKVTRVKLDRCTVDGCPRPDSEAFHRNVCGHWDRPPTHLHAPKKGMGGKNPKSKIRGCACLECHDACDNFGGSAIVQTKDGKRFIGWQGFDADPIKRKVLWDVPLDAHELVEESDEILDSSTASNDGHPVTRSARRSSDWARNEGEATGGSRPSDTSGKDDAWSVQRQDAYSLTEQGIDFTECTFDDWKSAWVQIAGLTRNKAWWVGDAWNYAEARWPDAHGQIIEELTELAGLRIETVSNYANVAKAFPRARRRVLSFDHHATVYRLPSKEQDEWLDRAEAEGLSSTELRALVHPPEPKPKRWSLEELRTALRDWSDGVSYPADRFLDWLQEQLDG